VETALQQRVVGAIVLVSLAVIFIPALLDGAGYKSRHARSIEVPPKPAFPPMSQQRVEPVATPLDKDFDALKQAAKSRKVSVGKAGDESSGAESTARSSQSGKAAVAAGNKAADNALKAWMLQVGTFSKRENANKYRDELRRKGYTAQVFEDSRHGKPRYRVRIGPDLSRERMEKLRQKLEKQGVEGYIVSHG